MSEIRLKIMGVIEDIYLPDSREGEKRKSLRIHFQTTYLTKIFTRVSVFKTGPLVSMFFD